MKMQPPASEPSGTTKPHVVIYTKYVINASPYDNRVETTNAGSRHSGQTRFLPPKTPDARHVSKHPAADPRARLAVLNGRPLCKPGSLYKRDPSIPQVGGAGTPIVEDNGRPEFVICTVAVTPQWPGWRPSGAPDRPVSTPGSRTEQWEDKPSDCGHDQGLEQPAS